MASKTTKLNNGLEVPLIGLGTWKSNPEDVIRAVKDAIDCGYRHIDCSPLYENEKEIGIAINAKIEEGVVKRDDLFITSKLWNTHHHPDLVEVALRNTIRDLGVDFLDMYLVHWPFGFKESDEYFPLNEDKTIAYSDVDYVDTWKSMENMLKIRLVKAIGVSNFNKNQLERIIEHGTIIPVINQVECSPYLNQSKLLNFCESKDITLTAYSPLGSGDRSNYKEEDPNLFEDDTVGEMSSKYGKTVAQIALRYQVQRGIIAIPKSVSKSRMSENLDVFDFELDVEDMEILNGLDCNYRTCKSTRSYSHKYHPFYWGDEY